MIDLCIALNGPHVDLMLPAFLGTMFLKVDMSQIHLHFVDKGCSDSVKRHLASLNCTVHTQPEGEEPLGFDHDAARTCQWMVDNCGIEEWVFISHFDVLFYEDLIAHYLRLITDDVGQIGEHCSGLVGYRRKAIAGCSLGFHPVSGFCVVKDVNADWKVRHGSDYRCDDKTFRITGFDVAELLELNLAATGWRVVVVPSWEWKAKLFHIRGGSGYHGPEVNAFVHANAEAQLHALGFPKLPA